MENKKEKPNTEIVHFKYAFKNIKTGAIIFTNNVYTGKNYVLLNIEFEDILTYE